MPEFETIDLSTCGAEARLTLSRPQQRNALSRSGLREILEAVACAAADPEIRVLVLQGAGESFCAGADLRDFSKQMMRRDAAALRALADEGETLIRALREARPVTIASIRGSAIGGGVLLAAACDLRLASEDATFAVPEVAIGLPMTWGGVELLTAEIGRSRARELIITGRRIDAAQAQAIGLVHRLLPTPEALEIETRALAETLASRAPRALELAKQQLTPGGVPERTDADLFVEAALDPGFLPAAMRYVQSMRR